MHVIHTTVIYCIFLLLGPATSSKLVFENLTVCWYFSQDSMKTMKPSTKHLVKCEGVFFVHNGHAGFSLTDLHILRHIMRHVQPTISSHSGDFGKSPTHANPIKPQPCPVLDQHRQGIQKKESQPEFPVQTRFLRQALRPHAVDGRSETDLSNLFACCRLGARVLLRPSFQLSSWQLLIVYSL